MTGSATSAPSEHVHASVVALGEAGVMIRGPSGAGKSSLALALVAEGGRRRDFARLVGDDRVSVRVFNGRALLAPHAALAGLAEWRGLGLIEGDHEPGVVLRLIVDLECADASTLPRLPESEEFRTQFKGLQNVPRLRLPARSTERNVATILAFLNNINTK